jgi:hypothetical protein
MAARIFGLAALVVGGIMLADVLIHPSGTKAASAGIASIASPAESSLLGVSPGGTGASGTGGR